MRTRFHFISICTVALWVSCFAPDLNQRRCSLDEDCPLAYRCSSGRCSSLPPDPPPPAGELALLTHRLPKAGGRVAIQAVVPPGTQVKLVLPNLTVDCSVLIDGQGSCEVSAEQLALIPPGVASVTLQAGEQQVADTLRIYLPPVFQNAAGMKATYSTGARFPGWVQVARGHLFSLEYSASNGRVTEYTLSGSTLSLVIAREIFTTPLPLSAQLGINERQAVRARQDIGAFALEKAELQATTDVYSAFSTLALSQVNSLAVSRDSTLVAVAGEGIDGPLKAFVLPAPLSNDSFPVTLTGLRPKTVKQVALGRLTDTSGPDLVAAHTDGLSVFLGNPAGKGPSSLVLDSTLSGLLSGTLNGAALTAMAIGDVDGDGLDDLITLQGTSLQVLTIEGRTVTTTPLLSGESLAIDALTIGDVSGDGRADLVVASKSSASLTVFINQAR